MARTALHHVALARCIFAVPWRWEWSGVGRTVDGIRSHPHKSGFLSQHLFLSLLISLSSLISIISSHHYYWNDRHFIYFVHFSTLTVTLTVQGGHCIHLTGSGILIILINQSLYNQSYYYSDDDNDVMVMVFNDDE